MIKNLFNSYIFILFLALLTVCLLLNFAGKVEWKHHLSSDIYGFYFPRADYFFKNLKFGGFLENEYFPGAMFFFLLPTAAFLFGPYGWEQYLNGLFLINILIITILLFIYKKYSIFSAYLFIVFLLAAGPIILYRHELFVTLILITSLLLYKKKYFYASSFILGIATAIKIFPLLVFPYYLIISFKKNIGKSVILKEVCFFALGILTVGLMYLAFGKLFDITSALTVNSIKPVHAESIWGSVLPLISKLNYGIWAIGKGAHGIFGIDSQFILFPLYFYNYFFILPLGILYIYLYKKSNEFKLEAVILIILLFEIFSKILTPQYLFWFVLIFPLILKNNRRHLAILSSMTIIFMLYLTQYLYPLNYDALLSGFFLSGQEIDLYLLLLCRNFLMILLFMQLLIYHAKK